MNKQTQQSVVEFLEKVFLDPYKNRPFIQKDDWEEAKRMFRQQIINAHGDEQSHLQDDGSWRTVTAEQYYKETYESSDSNCEYSGLPSPKSYER